jgi:Trypsin-co-occurring domain 1
VATKLIELADGVLVEIEVPPEQAQAISGGIADKVAGTFDKVGAQLKKLCAEMASDWKVVRDLKIDQVEVELGLSFEVGGNVYLARTTAAGNLAVRVSFKPTD